MSTMMLLVPVIVSLLLQVVKDHIRVSPQALTLVAAIGGAIATAAQQMLTGDPTGANLAIAASAGALLTPGTHDALLQDKTPGKMLKAVGAALLGEPTPTPPPAS